MAFAHKFSFLEPISVFVPILLRVVMADGVTTRGAARKEPKDSLGGEGTPTPQRRRHGSGRGSGRKVKEEPARSQKMGDGKVGANQGTETDSEDSPGSPKKLTPPVQLDPMQALLQMMMLEKEERRIEREEREAKEKREKEEREAKEKREKEEREAKEKREKEEREAKEKREREEREEERRKEKEERRKEKEERDRREEQRRREEKEDRDQRAAEEARRHEETMRLRERELELAAEKLEEERRDRERQKLLDEQNKRLGPAMARVRLELPKMRDGEDLDAYLIHFERLMEQQGWARDTWGST